MCSNFVIALDLADEIKLLSPATHVTFGGPHISLFCPTKTLDRHHSVDTAVVGRRRSHTLQLIRCLEQSGDLSAVLGIAFRRDGQAFVTARRPLLTDLNLSPRPAYDLIDISSYAKTARSNYLEVYAGSGCPFLCTFCSTSIVWERKYRTMSADRIVSEMEELSTRHGAVAFNLIHDNLTTNKPFIVEIASLILARGLNIRWGFSSRVDTIDLDTIRLVSDAGCDYVFFGIESGSERIQATMKKAALKLKTIWAAVEQCISHGIAHDFVHPRLP